MMTFEEALLYEISKVEQANKNLEKAEKQSKKDNGTAQAAEGIKDVAAKTLGLQPGATLTPAEVMEKLKSDPSLLDKLAKINGFGDAVEMKPEDIINLKNAASLGSGESDNATPPPPPAKPATCATADNDANMNDQQKQAWKSIVMKLNQITGANGGK